MVIYLLIVFSIVVIKKCGIYTYSCRVANTFLNTSWTYIQFKNLTYNIIYKVITVFINKSYDRYTLKRNWYVQ